MAVLVLLSQWWHQLPFILKTPIITASWSWKKKQKTLTNPLKPCLNTWVLKIVPRSRWSGSVAGPPALFGPENTMEVAGDQQHWSGHRALLLLRSLSRWWELPSTITLFHNFPSPPPALHSSLGLLLPGQEPQQLKEAVRSSWGPERERPWVMALKAASKRHLHPQQGSVFAQVSP